jgi:hypothetical protein
VLCAVCCAGCLTLLCCWCALACLQALFVLGVLLLNASQMTPGVIGE